MWVKLFKRKQDDPRMSRGLQLLQSKIAVLEDLSDRTELQVKQLAAGLGFGNGRCENCNAGSAAASKHLSSSNGREGSMAWIRTEDIGVPGIIGVMSINQTMLEAVRSLNQSVSFGSSALTRVQEESIATAVSVINRCRY